MEKENDHNSGSVFGVTATLLDDTTLIRLVKETDKGVRYSSLGNKLYYGSSKVYRVATLSSKYFTQFLQLILFHRKLAKRFMYRARV